MIQELFGRTLSTLESILSFKPNAKVIVSSGNEDRANAVEAIRLGAYDFYPKPVDIDVLKMIIDRATHLYELEDEFRRLQQSNQASPLDGIVAISPQMLKACEATRRVASSDVSVLLTGESGIGKEVLARAIHDASPRKGEPFVAINCAAIPENLLEKELFGHEKGAFTGAIKLAIGKVEQANNGTLMLDEIGDMPLMLRAKLLRFLQERNIERVGGRQPIPVNVRVVSATNQDLSSMIQEGTFREDLYYRIEEVGIHIPPVRDREGDAVLLENFFLKKFEAPLHKKIGRFTKDALAVISNYRWPGNVREIENKIKRAMVLAEGNTISAEDLGIDAATTTESILTLKQVREKAEYSAISQALELSQNNVSATAKLLGVSRPTLYDSMKSLKSRN
ncbi:MAG: two-component system NtrC family response regulator [Alphaproteobacteria bacterium]|jgi:two-component system NtrC family response regulator